MLVSPRRGKKSSSPQRLSGLRRRLEHELLDGDDVLDGGRHDDLSGRLGHDGLLDGSLDDGRGHLERGHLRSTDRGHRGAARVADDVGELDEERLGVEHDLLPDRVTGTRLGQPSLTETVGGLVEARRQVRAVLDRIPRLREDDRGGVRVHDEGVAADVAGGVLELDRLLLGLVEDLGQLARLLVEVEPLRDRRDRLARSELDGDAAALLGLVRLDDARDRRSDGVEVVLRRRRAAGDEVDRDRVPPLLDVVLAGAKVVRVGVAVVAEVLEPLVDRDAVDLVTRGGDELSVEQAVLAVLAERARLDDDVVLRHGCSLSHTHRCEHRTRHEGGDRESLELQVTLH